MGGVLPIGTVRTKNQGSGRVGFPAPGGKFGAGKPYRGATSEVILEFTFVLEDLGPIPDQLVECLLRSALIGDHVVMQAFLHGL